jgi:tetratricopeptide (TPR) repeat protein
MDLGAGGNDPYVGQRAYDVADQEIFFGRASECDDLKTLLAGQPIVVLHGSAGSGKTSLLRAALAPALSGDAEVLAAGRPVIGSPFPEAALPDHNPYTAAVLNSWRPAESPARLAVMTLTEFLRDRAEDRGWSSVPLRVIAIIDQLEEIFSDRRATQQREFLADIAQALRAVRTLRVVLAVRSEDVGELAAYSQMLGLVPESYYHLEPLDRISALDAVRRPMQLAREAMSDETAELLVDELASRVPAFPAEFEPSAGSYVEPAQLQACCIELSHAVRSRQLFTADAAGMRRLVDTSLAGFTARAVSSVAVEQGVDLQEVSDWIRTTFVTAEGVRARVPVAASGLTRLELTIAEALVNRHVAKATVESGARCYVLASERLVPAVLQEYEATYGQRERVTDVLSLLAAAMSALAVGQFEAAQRHAEHARDASGDDLRLRADAYSVLGNVAYNRSRMDAAEANYMEAAQLREQLQDQPSVGQLLGAIGRIQQIRGRYTAAVEDLQAAVTRLPGDLSLHTELAKALWNAGQPQAAAAVFGSVLMVEPASAEALAGRGQIRAESGDASAALHDLQTLQRIRPAAGQKPEVRSAYALALAQTGSADMAMTEADAALESAPDSGLVFWRAARVASEARSPERAAELLRKAVAATDPALSADQLAEVRRLLSRLTEAGVLC